MNIKPPRYWEEQAEVIRLAYREKQPPLKIREVAEALGVSTGMAVYTLSKLRDMGFVYYVENGGKGEWFLI